MFKRYSFFLVLAFGFSLFTIQYAFAQLQAPVKGTKAPLFNAKATLAGNEFDFSLEKALAKGPVVVYFYPAAYTGGCDLEAHTFAEFKDKFTAAGATIIGVSADNIKRLDLFSSDPDYCAGKFAVASDPDGKIAATYGLKVIPPRAGMKDIKGKEVTHGFIPRTTFVLNKGGAIVAIFSSRTDHISPDEHVKESLAIVKKL